MATQKSSILDTLMFVAFVALTVAFAGAAIFFFYKANQERIANAAVPSIESEAKQTYTEATSKLLEKGGWADDRALGGEAGQSKRAEKLGFKRTPITVAMASVRQDLAAGSWHPVRLSAEQLAVIDRLEMGNITPEAILAASQQSELLQQGMAVFKANCAACHGAAGNGLVGPNLTDTYYLHGRGPTNVYKILVKGVAAKGMPPWGHLGEEKLKLVAGYVLSLEGKNLEGKAPQGVDADGNPPPTSTGG